MDPLSKLNLNFQAGQGIKAADLQKLAKGIDDLIDRVNYLMLKEFDVNAYFQDYSASYNLEYAIALVPTNRRQLGMKLRYRTVSGLYAEYSYIGATTNNGDFNAAENWISGIEIVDGGEF